MSIDILVRYLHFLGILTWFAALMGEWMLFDKQLSMSTIQRLRRIDQVYGLAAIVVVATGLLQWFVVGKPANFYDGNVLLYLKISLAIVIGLLSIGPSFWLAQFKAGKPTPDLIVVPPRIGLLVQIQLALFLALPLLASLMAQGIGK